MCAASGMLVYKLSRGNGLEWRGETSQSVFLISLMGACGLTDRRHVTMHRALGAARGAKRDGAIRTRGNFQRPFLLFKAGAPAHLYAATSGERANSVERIHGIWLSH